MPDHLARLAQDTGLSGSDVLSAHLVHRWRCADLRGNWLAWLGVVHVGGDVELQEVTKLLDDVGWGAVQVLPLELVVRLDDLCQLMGEVILRPTE